MRFYKRKLVVDELLCKLGSDSMLPTPSEVEGAILSFYRGSVKIDGLLCKLRHISIPPAGQLGRMSE